MFCGRSERLCTAPHCVSQQFIRVFSLEKASWSTDCSMAGSFTVNCYQGRQVLRAPPFICDESSLCLSLTLFCYQAIHLPQNCSARFMVLCRVAGYGPCLAATNHLHAAKVNSHRFQCLTWLWLSHRVQLSSWRLQANNIYSNTDCLQGRLFFWQRDENLVVIKGEEAI